MNNFNLPLLNVGAPQGLVMNPISIEDLLTLDPSTTVFFYPLHQGDIPNINGNAFHVPGTTIAIFYNMPRDGSMNDLGNPVVLSLLNIRQALDLAVVMANGEINRPASGMEAAPAAVPATAPIPVEADAVVAQQDAPVLGDDEGMVDEPIAELTKDPASSRDKLRLRISPDLTSVKVTNEHGELIKDDVPAGPSRENEALVSDLQSPLENQKEEHPEALTAARRAGAERASALQVQLTAAQEDLETEKAKSEALEKQAEDLKDGHKKELQAQKSTHEQALNSEETKHKNELEAAVQKCKEEVEKVAEEKLAKMESTHTQALSLAKSKHEKMEAEIKEYQMRLEKAENLEKKVADLKEQLRQESEGHEKALEELRKQMRDQDVAHSKEIAEAIKARDEEARKAFYLDKKLKAVIENPESKVQELLGAALQEQKTQLEAANKEKDQHSAKASELAVQLASANEVIKSKEDLVSELRNQLENQTKEHSDALAAALRNGDTERDQMKEVLDANSAELEKKVKEAKDNADREVERRVAEQRTELSNLVSDAQTTIEREVERRIADLKKKFDERMKDRSANDQALSVERARYMEIKNFRMMEMETMIATLQAKIQMLQSQLAAQNTRSSSRGVSQVDTTSRGSLRQGIVSRPATSNDVQVMVVSSDHQSPPAPTLPEDSEAFEAPTTTLPEAGPEHAARPELADDWEQATDVRKN